MVVLVRSAVAAGIVAGLAALAFVVVSVGRTAAADPTGPAYVRTFDDTRDPLEATLATGDGQAFAALARDPTMATPDVFYGGAPEAAYRAQRPLSAYVAWAIALGRPGLVPGALVAVTVLSTAAAAVALGALLERRGGAPLFGAVVAVLPPTVAAAQWIGPELLGIALATAGIALWPTRPRLAAVCFGAAGLSRETLLLVPLVAAAQSLGRRELGRSAVALLATVPWLAWVAVVRWRLGHWSWEASAGRLSAPFGGVREAVGTWSAPAAELACLLLAVALVVAAVRSRRDLAALVVVAYAVFATVMGANVWLRWEDFVRPLAPLYVFGVAVALTGRRRNSANTAGANTAIGTAQTALQ